MHPLPNVYFRLYGKLNHNRKANMIEPHKPFSVPYPLRRVDAIKLIEALPTAVMAIAMVRKGEPISAETVMETEIMELTHIAIVLLASMTLPHGEGATGLRLLLSFHGLDTLPRYSSPTSDRLFAYSRELLDPVAVWTRESIGRAMASSTLAFVAFARESNREESHEG
jgi:hypothetical protein